MIASLIFSVTLMLAFANGANDNFKGFATAWGAETLSYERALVLATIATLAGGLAAMAISTGLVEQFSGKGLVPNAVAGTPAFLAAVALAAGATVLVASRLGLPVSTTHALIGGLVGGGLAEVGAVDTAKLWGAFLMPMLLSPLIAGLLSFGLARLMRRSDAGHDCVCVTLPAEVPVFADGTLAHRQLMPQLIVASATTCAPLSTPFKGSLIRGRDRLHVLSAATVCFARGINDAPKMAALLFASGAVGLHGAVAGIAAAMATGGLLFARRVAHTMSHRISRIDQTSGLAANLATALMVLFASRLGLPVSTTHVAVGAIAGAGRQSLDMSALRTIVLAWFATLPFAAALARCLVPLLRHAAS
ncbi:MAG: inorganic phosphate transporter [Gammaproteobacteria bacterium]|nr:inorganic phosphate transporter [Gammaproteobacteria bacterium]